jgi:hypothetical protein
VKKLLLYFRDKEGKEIKPPAHLKIEETPIQVQDFLNTDDYFELVGMTNAENQGKQMKDQGYFMMKKLIINPKITDAIIGSLPWNEFMKITKAMREEFMPEEAFLELGVQLDELSSE